MTRYQLFGANDTPMTRDEIVEENAIRFHVEDDHDGRFATCKKDCWFKSEQLFIEARNKGELVPIIEDGPAPLIRSVTLRAATPSAPLRP